MSLTGKLPTSTEVYATVIGLYYRTIDVRISKAPSLNIGRSARYRRGSNSRSASYAADSCSLNVACV